MAPLPNIDRRRKDRITSIFTFLRLAIELVAIVWAVAGLTNATNTLRDVVVDLKRDVKQSHDDIAVLRTDVRVIQASLTGNNR